MNADETVLDHLTDRIIGGALIVSNALGAGLLEKVSENALAHEIRKACPGGGRGLGPVSRWCSSAVSRLCTMGSSSVTTRWTCRLEIKRIVPGL